MFTISLIRNFYKNLKRKRSQENYSLHWFWKFTFNMRGNCWNFKLRDPSIWNGLVLVLYLNKIFFLRYGEIFQEQIENFDRRFESDTELSLVTFCAKFPLKLHFIPQIQFGKLESSRRMWPLQLKFKKQDWEFL